MRSSILALALLVTISAPAIAHPKGTIRLASKQLGVGGELVLRGESLPKNETLRLQMRGTLETFPLAEVRTNATGAFQARLALPMEARMGSYTVVVLASDGDVAAQAELLVVAGAAPATVADSATAVPTVADKAAAERPAGHAMPNANTSPHPTGMPHASPDMMQLEATTSAAEWVGILAIIVASVGVGFALLRSRA